LPFPAFYRLGGVIPTDTEGFLRWTEFPVLNKEGRIVESQRHGEHRDKAKTINAFGVEPPEGGTTNR
jgi:hypothetical protein